MRIHVIQHVSFEGPALILDWANKHGYAVTKSELFANPTLDVDLAQLDMLVVMGGPMGVTDVDTFPWLSDELALIKSAIAQQKWVLGICLGAQLIASALGAKIEHNPQPEIGWFPVAILDDAQSHPILKGFNSAMTVLHWHGDLFAIPDGAQRLMRSEACVNQAFIHGQRTLGLQFHLEMNNDAIELLLAHAESDLISAPFVQSAAQIREQAATHVTQFWLDKLLNNWLAISES